MIVIIFLSLLLRLISLNQSFWLDEAIQAVLSQQNLQTINWAADFQPPLYYVLTHWWMKLTVLSEWFLRIPSVIFGVMTVYVTYIFAKKLFSEKVARFSSLLLATSAYHIYYSQEFRMYSLFTLLSVLSWFLLYEKKWKSLALTNTLMLFTHYFGFLVMISQLSFYLLTNTPERKKFITTLVISLVPFIYWSSTFYKQIQTAQTALTQFPGWSRVLGVSFWRFPPLILAKYTVGVASPENKIIYAFLVIIVSIIFLTAVIRMFHASSFMIRQLNANSYTLLLCSLFIPLLLGWFSSPFLSANAPHRFVFLLPFFYVILAAGLMSDQKNNDFVTFTFLFQLRKNSMERMKFLMRVTPPFAKGGVDSLKKTSFGLFVLKRFSQKKSKVNFVLVMIVISNFYFTSSYLLNSKYHREDWRGAVAYTDAKIGESGIVLTEFNGPFAPMTWYSKTPQRYVGGSSIVQISDASVKERIDPYLLNTTHFILYTYLFQLTDNDRRLEKYLLYNGFTVTDERDFRGVGIVKTFSL